MKRCFFIFSLALLSTTLYSLDSSSLQAQREERDAEVGRLINERDGYRKRFESSLEDDRSSLMKDLLHDRRTLIASREAMQRELENAKKRLKDCEKIDPQAEMIEAIQQERNELQAQVESFQQQEHALEQRVIAQCERLAQKEQENDDELQKNAANPIRESQKTPPQRSVFHAIGWLGTGAVTAILIERLMSTKFGN